MIRYISIVNARNSENNIEIEKVVLACKILNKKKTNLYNNFIISIYIVVLI